jgi:hypothetical protein
MDLFSKEVYTFLNNLDTYIPCLLREPTREVIKTKVLCDINAMLLHANEYAILNRVAQLVVKKFFDVDALAFRTSAFTSTKDNTTHEYVASDYHMEFDLNDKSLEYIKGMISNRTISQRNFVFIIKNAEQDINRNTYLALRRLIDINSSSRFIITTTSITFMEKSLVSRCLLLNCSFPIINLINSSVLLDLGFSPSEIDDTDKLRQMYCDSNNNIITLLQNMRTSSNGLLWHASIHKLLQVFGTEKNQLLIIHTVREHVYKLYHVGVRLSDIMTFVIRELVKNDSKSKKTVKKSATANAKMHNVVMLAAECDHLQRQGGKDIFLYERFFLSLYKIM